MLGTDPPGFRELLQSLRGVNEKLDHQTRIRRRVAKGGRQGTSLPVGNWGPSMWALLSTLISALLGLHAMAPSVSCAGKVCPGGFQLGVSTHWPMTTFYLRISVNVNGWIARS